MKVIGGIALALAIAAASASASVTAVACSGRFVVDQGGFSISGVGVKASTLHTRLCAAGRQFVTDAYEENFNGKSGVGRNRVARFTWLGSSYRCDGLALAPHDAIQTVRWNCVTTTSSGPPLAEVSWSESSLF